MTEEQAGHLFREIFVAFPGVAQWVRDNSPDKAATIKVWAKTLANIEVEEGISVLNRWITGELKVPTGYQLQTFPLELKAFVMADRTRKMQQQNREKIFEQNRRTSTFAKMPILGPFMEKVLAIKAQWEKGVITDEYRESQIHELEQGAIRQVDESYKRQTGRVG